MINRKFKYIFKYFYHFKIFILNNTKNIYFLISPKKRKNFIKKLKIKYAFLIHEEVVKMLFGKVYGDYKDFVLSEDINNLLLEYLKILFKDQADLDEKESFEKDIINGLENSSLLLNNSLPDLDEFLKNTHSHVNLDPSHPTTKILHKEIRKHIDSFIKSPYSFINSHAWKTYPNSKSWGPNSLHTDEFEAGHLKIMIYPKGLNGKNGGFYLENHGEFNNCPPGFCICFKNSDVKHNGIPGNLEDRISIEITVQRTFASLPQTNQSHIDGRHLKGPMDIYVIGNKE